METGESSEIYSESSEILKDLKVSPWVVLGVLVSPRVHISMRRVPVSDQVHLQPSSHLLEPGRPVVRATLITSAL